MNVLRRVSALIVLLAWVAGAAALAAEETVAFNVETKKYHCLSCRWAIACTKNCVEIGISEARRRGGVPCKVCGGSCKNLVSQSPLALSGARCSAPNNSFQGTRHAHLWLAALGAIVLARP
jgi:hypothetical protein